jgi:hypothetical protein
MNPPPPTLFMPDAASHTDPLRRTLPPGAGPGRAAAPRERKKPLIDVHILNIYRSETFRQHFGALLVAIVIRAVVRPGCLIAHHALALRPNDAR